jgi:hypothetical protein
MSDTAEAREPEAPELAPEAGAEKAAPDVSGETDEDIELEALAMGWKPESQFKGPKDKFVSAAEYVERGKTIMPFLRKELAGAYKKIEGLEKAVKTAISHSSKAEQRAYERAKADLEAELDAAAAAGNAADVRAITKDIVELERDTLAKAEAATDDDEPEWFVDWKAENDWFGTDKARSASAAAFAEEAIKDGYSGKALAKEVDRKLREEFPHKYAKPTNPNRAAPAAVEGAGAARRSGAKTFSDLPADAQAMCLELMKDIPSLTKDKYVKEYFS